LYFGFDTIWTYTFIPVSFVLVMVVGIALAFVYAVGASKGRAAALSYTRAWTAILVVGLVGLGIYAVATGQLQGFLRVFGWGPLTEMVVLAVMFLGSMLLMATSYLSSKKA